MATITITIPQAKVAKALEGFLELYPNGERKDNPAYVDSEQTPDEEEFLEELRYTNAQWVNEKMKRILVRDIHRGLNMKAKKELIVEIDDTLVE
jgi:hypothetical protein